jgi:hypothetical protein
VSRLRPELAAVVDDLVRHTAKGGAITLDAIGDAIGTRAASADEIDVMLSMLEEQGRHVVSPEGGSGESKLKRVLDAARVLRAELGRPPRHDEIAARAGISREDVQHALALARIMQR